jgi:RNA polymerase sigma-70 factor (ECF subfamily)
MAMAGDDEILALIARGERDAAATAIIRTHGPDVADYLRAVLRDEDLAADAFSLFAEWVWAALPKFRGRSSLRTWCFGVAWNAQQKVLSQAWRRRRRRLRSDEMSQLAAEVMSSTTSRPTSELDRFAELRRNLKPEEQALLTLRIGQRLEWSDIAIVLAGSRRPASAVALRKRFERIKARLGQMAHERGLVGA